MRRGQFQGCGFEFFPFREDGPKNAGVLVGYCDQALVVADAGLQLDMMCAWAQWQALNQEIAWFDRKIATHARQDPDWGANRNDVTRLPPIEAIPPNRGKCGRPHLAE